MTRSELKQMFCVLNVLLGRTQAAFGEVAEHSSTNLHSNFIHRAELELICSLRSAVFGSVASRGVWGKQREIKTVCRVLHAVQVRRCQILS